MPLPGTSAPGALPVERLYDAPEGTEAFEAAASPSGNRVVVRCSGSPAAFDLVDLRDGVHVSRGVLQESPGTTYSLLANGVSFSPSERRIVLSEEKAVGIFELETGGLRHLATVARPPLRRGVVRIPVVWSADEREAAFYWGDVIDIGSGQSLEHPRETVTAFLDGDRVVAANETLAVRALRTGSVLSRPLVRN